MRNLYRRHQKDAGEQISNTFNVELTSKPLDISEEEESIGRILLLAVMMKWQIDESWEARKGSLDFDEASAVSPQNVNIQSYRSMPYPLLIHPPIPPSIPCQKPKMENSFIKGESVVPAGFEPATFRV